MPDSPRTRRLRSDLRTLQALQSESSIFEFDPLGTEANAPDAYFLRFRGQGVWRPPGSQDVLLRNEHVAAIRLGANYPRMMPELMWKSPIFHPNISSNGFVCLGGFGTFWAPSLNLGELCGMLWNMVRYENFDIHSPYNREAAVWAKTQQTFAFPLDAHPLRNQPAPPAGALRDLPRMPGRALPVALPPDIVFLDEVIDAEVVPSSEEEVLIIDR